MSVPGDSISGASATGQSARLAAGAVCSIGSPFARRMARVSGTFNLLSPFTYLPFLSLSLAVLADKLPCWTHAKNKRPLRQTRACAERPCPAHWWPGPWQFCPLTCRQPGAPLPQRRRSIVCLDQHDVVVVDALCSLLPKPPETEPCEASLPECRAKP